MNEFAPKDLAFRDRVQTSFARQGLMSSLGASLVNIAPGIVEIALPASPQNSQQHGFVHAGAIAAIADTAAGYAALSLMPSGVGVLTVEFKINLLAPALGDIRAQGCVVKAGRTLTLAQTEVFSGGTTTPKLVAVLSATLMTIEGREAIAD